MRCIEWQPAVRQLFISSKVINVFSLAQPEQDAEDGGMFAQDEVGIDGWEFRVEDFDEDLVEFLATVRGEVGLGLLDRHEIGLLVSVHNLDPGLSFPLEEVNQRRALGPGRLRHGPARWSTVEGSLLLNTGVS